MRNIITRMGPQNADLSLDINTEAVMGATWASRRHHLINLIKMPSHGFELWRVLLFAADGVI